MNLIYSSRKLHPAQVIETASAIRKKECELPRQDLATPSQQTHFERFLQVM
jgi:hypothetical protein